MSKSETLGLSQAVPPRSENREDLRGEARAQRSEAPPRLVGLPLPVGDAPRTPPPSVSRTETRTEPRSEEASRLALPPENPRQSLVADPANPPESRNGASHGLQADAEAASTRVDATPAPEPAPLFPPVSAPERTLAAPPPAPRPFASEEPTGMQRAVRALRSAVPYVQKILPLLDGNFATAVANLLGPHQHQHPAPLPQPPVDLEPITSSLAELRTQHRDLRVQIIDQNSSLKRVEDQLEMVREATDRNTLEQQELIEDLKAVGNKVNLFAVIALCLLAASVVLNVILYTRLHR